ncbi:TPA: ABC transporter ATP-binding protein [Yersinia enterocolitica]|nr:ABC transporter ATP-binding protein [Yersinia enterocolitica]EKN3612272.1 ABC transporter ATP-binding protein [Yersinia enterocolitica]EKN3735309.1 ABC transporter ATP-binding protein [Yersinia enterocolitica]EKN3872795.1 ABC transporter ATP-binding protein [Yersinia enterocolitica]EKN3953948.1 ABC transporter ATP-binding protein [Yersinia enterocolitica]EKN4031309.1 ABC transporter ATP-binding protein [Yersinia enterocolitica]
MMTNIAISVHNVSKCYRVFDDQRSRLLHAIWPKYIKGVQDVWALKDINFEVQRGEAVALIGRNGGGKSTLLEILTGTLTPTTGEVNVNGRVSALLELGSGFNPEYSGRDNVILNGLLLGLSKQEIVERFNEIETFAGIGAAIERPVKTYSSGMIMRLAFSVQVLCDPDILIIDEALSVGDFFFQQKCFSYIRGLRAKGVTLLFVSHDMGTVRDLCSRALYLQQGQMVWNGEVNAAIQRYLGGESSVKTSAVTAITLDEPMPQQKLTSEKPWQSAALWQREIRADAVTQIVAVVIEDIAGNATQLVRLGETLRLIVWYQANEIEPVHVSVLLKNAYEQLVNCTSSYTLGIPMLASTDCNLATFTLDLDFNLEAGQYSIMVSLGVIGEQPNQGTILDETPYLGPLTVRWDYSTDIPPFFGMFGVPVRANSPVLYQEEI